MINEWNLSWLPKIHNTFVTKQILTIFLPLLGLNFTFNSDFWYIHGIEDAAANSN